MPPKRSTSCPPKIIHETMRKCNPIVIVCDINTILEMQGIDLSTGLPVGVTQEEFDQKNAD